MDLDDKYESGDVLFSSTKTLIHKALVKSTKQEVLLKKSAESFPSFSTVESFKKDFQFTKLLHSSYPENFINMVEMFPQKNGSVVLVEKSGGESLQIFLNKKKKLTSGEFLKIAIEMTKSLHFAHSKQILHRDVKLGNFIFSEGKVMLIDFGLSVMVSRKCPSLS
eukprot:gene13089-8444_t